MDTEPLPVVAIGCDHAAVALKRHLAQVLREAGHAVLDMGTHDEARVDYPDFAHAVCAAVEDGRAQRGVLVCGSGVGMSIALGPTFNWPYRSLRSRAANQPRFDCPSWPTRFC